MATDDKAETAKESPKARAASKDKSASSSKGLGFVVAPGKAVTTGKKGLIRAGGEIKPEWVDDIDLLVKKGFVTKS